MCIHAHFQFLNPAKCCFSDSQSSRVLPKQQKSLFLWSNTASPSPVPALGWVGKKRGRGEGIPISGVAVLEWWGLDRQTDMTQIPSLSPAWRDRAESSSSVSQPVPLKLWGFLHLSLLQAEGIPAPRDCWKPAEPHRGEFLAISRPVLLAEPLEHSAEDISSWHSSSLPISFGALALLSMKMQKVTGSLIFFCCPMPSNDPTIKCYFHWRIVSSRNAKMLKPFPWTIKVSGPEKARRGKDKEGWNICLPLKFGKFIQE